MFAHVSTAVEMGVPIALFFSTEACDHHSRHGDGLLPSRYPVRHPDGVPLEWNVFMLFSVLTLFGARTPTSVWPT